MMEPAELGRLADSGVVALPAHFERFLTKGAEYPLRGG